MAFALFGWGESRGWSFLSNFGLRADDHNGFVPDLIGLVPAPNPDADAVYAETAFLVADVIWDTTKHSRATKMRGYARAGVELYLIVDPVAKTIEIYRLDGETYGARNFERRRDLVAARIRRIAVGFGEVVDVNP